MCQSLKKQAACYNDLCCYYLIHFFVSIVLLSFSLPVSSLSSILHLSLSPLSLYSSSPLQTTKFIFDFYSRLANSYLHHIKFLSCLKFDLVWVDVGHCDFGCGGDHHSLVACLGFAVATNISLCEWDLYVLLGCMVVGSCSWVGLVVVMWVWWVCDLILDGGHGGGGFGWPLCFGCGRLWLCMDYGGWQMRLWVVVVVAVVVVMAVVVVVIAMVLMVVWLFLKCCLFLLF